MYMSEFCCYVMLNFWRRSPAIYPWNPEKLGTRDMPSRNWNRRSLWVAAPKSLVHVEYEKLLENYLGAQGTFNPASSHEENAKLEHCSKLGRTLGCVLVCDMDMGTRYIGRSTRRRRTLSLSCVCSVWVPCVALPSGGWSSVGPSPLCGSPMWVPCAGPLCGSPVWVPCVGPLCVGPLCGSLVALRFMWHLLAWCLPLVDTLPLYHV